MELSLFAQRFAGESGIVDLMQDLGEALSLYPDMIFMGGGNPSRVSAAEAVYRERLLRLLGDPRRAHEVFGVYQLPQGDMAFRRVMAESLQRQYGWPLGPENIAVSNGSQAAFFVLFNLFAGEFPDGRRRHIELPLVPEYIGYSDIGLCDGLFKAARPSIELLSDGLFKYHVDFDRLCIDASAGAICVSRPTNPTGNVLTDEEVGKLDALARRQGIPLIIDGAYGTPFPQMIFTEAEPHWNDNTIVVLSLSKLGLPGLRTGIIVAREEIAQAYARANTILSLACGTIGPALATDLLRDGEMMRLSRECIRPFYRDKAVRTLDGFRVALGELPYRIHKPEGAMFLWLWFQDLPGGSQALYERLKQRGVLVVPGHNFFPGLAEPWSHREECIRVSYAQDAEIVARGIAIIADEVRRSYEGG
jgi:valine--pyruvate aminotransferase